MDPSVFHSNSSCKVSESANSAQSNLKDDEELSRSSNEAYMRCGLSLSCSGFEVPSAPGSSSQNSTLSPNIQLSTTSSLSGQILRQPQPWESRPGKRKRHVRPRGRLANSGPVPAPEVPSLLSDHTHTKADELLGCSGDSKERPELVCSICGDRAYSYNFGGVCCESCKSFFRRNGSRVEALSCVGSGDCTITKATRRFCSFCRMRRCIQVGMQLEWLYETKHRLSATGESSVSNSASESCPSKWANEPKKPRSKPGRPRKKSLEGSQNMAPKEKEFGNAETSHCEVTSAQPGDPFSFDATEAILPSSSISCKTYSFNVKREGPRPRPGYLHLNPLSGSTSSSGEPASLMLSSGQRRPSELSLSGLSPASSSSSSLICSPSYACTSSTLPSFAELRALPPVQLDQAPYAGSFVSEACERGADRGENVADARQFLSQDLSSISYLNSTTGRKTCQEHLNPFVDIVRSFDEIQGTQSLQTLDKNISAWPQPQVSSFEARSRTGNAVHDMYCDAVTGYISNPCTLPNVPLNVEPNAVISGSHKYPSPYSTSSLPQYAAQRPSTMAASTTTSRNPFEKPTFSGFSDNLSPFTTSDSFASNSAPFYSSINNQSHFSTNDLSTCQVPKFEPCQSSTISNNNIELDYLRECVVNMNNTISAPNLLDAPSRNPPFHYPQSQSLSGTNPVTAKYTAATCSESSQFGSTSRPLGSHFQEPSNSAWNAGVAVAVVNGSPVHERGNSNLSLARLSAFETRRKEQVIVRLRVENADRGTPYETTIETENLRPRVPIISGPNVARSSNYIRTSVARLWPREFSDAVINCTEAFRLLVAPMSVSEDARLPPNTSNIQNASRISEIIFSRMVMAFKTLPEFKQLSLQAQLRLIKANFTHTARWVFILYIHPEIAPEQGGTIIYPSVIGKQPLRITVSECRELLDSVVPGLDPLMVPVYVGAGNLLLLYRGHRFAVFLVLLAALFSPHPFLDATTALDSELLPVTVAAQSKYVQLLKQYSELFDSTTTTNSLNPESPTLFCRAMAIVSHLFELDNSMIDYASEEMFNYYGPLVQELLYGSLGRF